MRRQIQRYVAPAALWVLTALFVIGAQASGGSSDDDDGNAATTNSVEIKGVVQAMPAGGLIGSWTIAGKAVQTDASTKFDQENGQLAVGALVEVKGTKLNNGTVLAIRMEVDAGIGPGTGSDDGVDGDNDAEDVGDDDGEVTGAIVSLPSDGLLGAWNVAGQTVIVVSTTRLDQEHGALVVGAIVEVNGLPDATGAIVAGKIEVKSGSAGGSVPVPGNVEIVGLIEALPATGLAGNWQVGGRAVVVTDTTTLDAEHGAFVVGASVEAKGALDSAGNLVATKVETTAGNGAPVPALEFWGTVVELPSAAAGLVGVWKVDDKLVSVSPATKIEADDAPLAVGVTVEVHGWLQPDGMIEAEEVETRTVAGIVAGQGTKAVEFFNSALGHFFVTANPAEAAALDAAGIWQRTGQTFNVGSGASGVCRFYGMPPKGPDSHFFTADPAECQAVMTRYSAWTFEGHAFSATPPVNGQCPAGTLEVHRFFNNPTTAGDINHRFTVTPEAFQQTVALGWTHEGVVMCAQP